MQPDLVDQVLFDEEFDTEVQRKRTTSVSKMDRKDSAAPEEEEEEERPPMVNGLGGERHNYLFILLLLQFLEIVSKALLFSKFKPQQFFVCSFFVQQFIILFSECKKAGTFLFFPYHSFLQTNILRISCSACKVSTKSQPCKVKK